MTDPAPPDEATGEATDDVAAVVARVRTAHGDVVALDLGADRLQSLVDRLDLEVDHDRTEVRLVLGAACTTAARAVDQFVAALQLPYPATRGWEDLLDHLGNRGVSRRTYVVVADAADLLRHEETDVWHRLVQEVKAGPYCLGGGFTTLVLVDDGYSWEKSRFGSAVATERAAVDGRRHAARPRYVRDDLDDT